MKIFFVQMHITTINLMSILTLCDIFVGLLCQLGTSLRKVSLRLGPYILKIFRVLIKTVTLRGNFQFGNYSSISSYNYKIPVWRKIQILREKIIFSQTSETFLFICKKDKIIKEIFLNKFYQVRKNSLQNLFSTKRSTVLN
jgi:hypothetical protein